MLHQNKNVVVYYSRLPLKGCSGKTRIGNEIGNMDIASEFARKMILDMLAEYSPRENDDYNFVYYYRGSLSDFEEKDMYPVTEYIPQVGEGLNIKYIHERMSKLYTNIVIIGSDIPLLSHNSLLGAFEKIEQGKAVLAPVLDGGYGLIGMKGFVDLYTEITNWNSRSKGYHLADETLRLAEKKGLHFSLLHKTFDIDHLADIHALLKETSTNGIIQNRYLYLQETLRYLNNNKIFFPS